MVDRCYAFVVGINTENLLIHQCVLRLPRLVLVNIQVAWKSCKSNNCSEMTMFITTRTPTKGSDMDLPRIAVGDGLDER